MTWRFAHRFFTKRLNGGSFYNMRSIHLMRTSMTFNFWSVVKIWQRKSWRFFTSFISIKTWVMSLGLNWCSSHLTVCCPALLIIKSRLHFILKLHDLISLITFDVFENFLPMSFVLIPAHYIEMRLFSLKPFQHGFILSYYNLVVS